MTRQLFSCIFLCCLFGGTSQVQAQIAEQQSPSIEAPTVPLLPERELYFAYEESGMNVAVLDPGNQLLARSILLTNLYAGGNVSFSLSFDQQNWANFGMGPRYSSFFGMKNRLGCYCALVTDYGGGNKIRKEYFLSRGRCYSMFWNVKEKCWDLQENPCRPKG